jgi:hypothetical protein
MLFLPTALATFTTTDNLDTCDKTLTNGDLRWTIFESTGTDCQRAGTALGWSGVDTVQPGNYNTVEGCSTMLASDVTEGSIMYQNSAGGTTIKCGSNAKTQQGKTVQTVCACFVGPPCSDATTGSATMEDCMCAPDNPDYDSTNQLVGHNSICTSGEYCYQQTSCHLINDVCEYKRMHSAQPICTDTLYPTCTFTDGQTGNGGTCLCGSRNNYVTCSSKNGLYCNISPPGKP